MQKDKLSIRYIGMMRQITDVWGSDVGFQGKINCVLKLPSRENLKRTLQGCTKWH